MLNSCVILGRICFDLELKEVSNGQQLLRNVLAVDRNKKAADPEKAVDYIPFTLWGKSAQYIYDYAKKGTLIAISGSIRLDQYKAHDGTTKKSFYVNGAEVNILSSLSETPKEQIQPKKEISESPDEDLPF